MFVFDGSCRGFAEPMSERNNIMLALETGQSLDKPSASAYDASGRELFGAVLLGWLLGQLSSERQSSFAVTF